MENKKVVPAVLKASVTYTECSHWTVNVYLIYISSKLFSSTNRQASSSFSEKSIKL